MTEKNKHILVVEDEGLVAAFLCEILGDRGYVCASVDNGQDAVTHMRQTPADLVLMDIEIKGPIDGIQTAAQIGKFSAAPLIFLTAYKDDDTLFSAIDQKPSAYLVKPVTEAELIAAVTLALRNRAEPAKTAESPGPYRLCRQSGLIYEGEEPVALSKMERQLAALLLERPAQVVSQERILQSCWPGEAANASNVRNLVFKLRRKLPLAEIETFKDAGYRIVPQRL